MCCCRDTYGAPPVHSCFNCSVQRFGVSAHGVVSVLSFTRLVKMCDRLLCFSARQERAHAWLKDLEHSTPCLSRKLFATEKSDHPRFVCPVQLLVDPSHLEV